MTAAAPPTLVLRVRRVIALTTVLIGAVVVGGWVLDIVALKSVLPGLTTMKANTAVGFMATGIGLYLLPEEAGRLPEGVRRHALASAMGMFAFALGAATLVEYVAAVRLGIDEFLFADPYTTSAPYNGRMSPATAAALVFAGAAIVFLARCAGRPGARVNRRDALTPHLLAIVPAGVGYLSLAGYTYEVEGLYSFGPFVSVALSTTLECLLVAAGIVLTLPDLGWRKGLADHPVAYGVLLRLLPGAVVLPFAAGAAVVWGARAHVYDPLFGPALFALAAAAGLVGLVWLAVAAVRRAENEVHSAEARFRGLFDSLFQFVWLLSPDGTMLEANQAALDFAGLTRTETVGHKLWNTFWWTIAPETAQRLRAAVDDAARGTFVRFEIEVRGAAQNAILDFSLRPVFDEHGAVALLVPEGRDITEMKQAVAARLESEGQLRLFIDRAPVAIAVFDADMRYRAASRRFLADFGLEGTDQAALIGRSHYDVFPCLPKQRRAMHRRVLAGETLSGDEDLITTGNGRADLVRWEMTPWHRADGAVGGAVLFAEVVTTRKQAEAVLAASEERFRTLASTMPALVFMTDAPGANTYVNSAFQQFTGRTADALLGDGWSDTLHPEDRDYAAATWAHAVETGDAYAAEYRFRHHAGGFRWHLIRCTPVRDADGNVVQWVGACVDVQEVVDARNMLAEVNSDLEARVIARTAELTTALSRVQEEIRERAAAEAQVRQLQKMEAVGQLTGGIAHDFNNMLAVVIGSLDIAKRRLGTGDARVIRYIEHAEDGAHRAAQLTARLLAFSRQTPLEPQVVNANKLINGMSGLLRRTLGEPIQVEIVLAGELWRSYADPGQIENAVLNLCVNARDAMSDGGKLTVETANCHLDDHYAAAHAGVTPGQFVMIAVTDTGTGMPPEVVERAFDPFYTTKSVGKGTGLGLSQVYGFTKQSGGHIKLYSEPGQGTTVKLYLPRYFGPDTAAAAAAVSRVASEQPRAREGEVVLLVEDEAAVREVSAEVLCELGYTVVSAADASQALATLASQPRVDLLFTDIVMPDMNGPVLAEQAVQCLPGLRVLFTTGYTHNAVVHNNVLHPSAAFLQKPFTVDQLARKIRSVLDG